MACTHTSKVTHTDTSFESSRPISAFSQWYFSILLYKLLPQMHLIQHLDYIMNATDYWPLVREYSIWNATVTALQFWTADLEPSILSSANKWVHTTFFYTTSMHLLCNQHEEVLFGYFMTMLKDTLERELALADEGYESGSKTSNLPTSSQMDIQNSPCYQWWKHLQPFYSMHHSYQIASLYATAYYLVVLKMKTFLKLMAHPIPAPHYHWIPWILQNQQPSPSIPYVMT